MHRWAVFDEDRLGARAPLPGPGLSIRLCFIMFRAGKEVNVEDFRFVSFVRFVP